MLEKSKTFFLTAILFAALGIFSVAQAATHTDLNPDPNDLDFGDVEVGDDDNMTVTLTNDHVSDSILITDVALDDDTDNEFDIETDECDDETLVAVTGECEITINFDPGDEEDYEGTLLVTIDGDATALEIDLDGTGEEDSSSSSDDAEFSVSDTSLDFEDTMVDYVSVQAFEVTNTGTGTINVDDLNLAGTDDDQYAVEDIGCLNVPLGPDDSCNVLVFFEPTTTGAKTAELEVFVEDADDEETIDLDGTAIAASTDATVTPVRKDFGEVEKGDNDSVDFTVDINVAAATMNVSLTGSNNFDIEDDECDGEEIGSGEDETECDITVNFNPTTGGLIHAVLEITAENDEFFIPVYAFVEGATGYPDDIEGNTFEANIKRLMDANVVAGFSDGTFRPDDPVTRGQLAKFIFNAFNITQSTSCGAFPDVPTTNTFYTHVTSLKCAGIIAGFPDGNYKPDAAVTRGEVTKFITEAMEEKGVDVDLTKTENFPDVDESDRFIVYIAYLSSITFEGQQIIKGYDDGEFKSSFVLTRGQMAKMIDISMRYYESL